MVCVPGRPMYPGAKLFDVQINLDRQYACTSPVTLAQAYINIAPLFKNIIMFSFL